MTSQGESLCMLAALVLRNLTVELDFLMSQKTFAAMAKPSINKFWHCLPIASLMNMFKTNARAKCAYKNALHPTTNSYFPCSFESFSAMQLGHAKADKHYAGATTHNGESNELLMLLTKGWQAALASPWTWSPARRNRRSHFLEADDKIYKSRRMSPENIKFVPG